MVGTGQIMELLKAKPIASTSANYCAICVTDHNNWGEKYDASTKAMLLLLNYKNDNTKKDLRLAYSQGNESAYSPTAKTMARYLST